MSLKKILSTLGVLVLFAIGHFLGLIPSSGDTAEKESGARSEERATDSSRTDPAPPKTSPSSREENRYGNPQREADKEESGDDGAQRVAELYDAGQSDAIIEVRGTVVKVLRDDLEGSRHQKFLLELSNDITLLVAHNIDLAQRVPLKEGDTVTLKGEYEWSEKGGTLHWTHHDPKGWHEDGWIRHNGETYM